MKKALYKASALFFFAVAFCLAFSLNSLAADEWTYANRLPSGVTDKNYSIEYKNIYKTVAASAPDSTWVKKGIAESRYENSGGTYESDFELDVSPTRVLVGCYYYHFCSASTGTRVDFAYTNIYHHYDSIAPGNFYESGTYVDDDDPRYTAYALTYHNGNPVSCSSGVTCDGAYGYHGARSNIWYKKYIYQNKVRVDYYNFEKQSGWTAKKDPSAADYTVRYKLNHVHSYGDWSTVKKATFTSDGSKERICKSCKQKQTAKIYKVSSVKLSATSYTYNGKSCKPGVTVKNSKGDKLPSKRYSVSYSKGRTDIGTYKVTVKLKGGYYSGTKTLSFKIVPSQVKKLKATPKKDAVSLSWSKVSGGVKYKVYSYNPSTKKQEYLLTASSNSCTVKKLSSRSTHYFVVKAYKKAGDKNYYGKDSSSVKCQPYGTPSKVTGLACKEKTSCSVTLSWKKASGNKVKYYISSYDSSSKKYKTLGSTTSTSYVIKNLKADKSYKYSVRAYSGAGEGYYGSRSDVYTVKTYKKLVSPLIGGLSASTERKLNNILVTWTADSTVTGYQIYRSTTNKSDSYKRVATIKSAKTSSWHDKDISPAQTYYYKIRSYKTRGEEKAYSGFKTAVKVLSYGGWKENPRVADFSYSFANSRAGFGYPLSYEIPLSSYHIIFGKTALAKELYEKYGVWKGSCHGMSATSAMMNYRKSGVTTGMFNASAGSVGNLKPDNTGSMGISVTQFIEAMQVSQMSSHIYSNRVWDDLDSLLNEVRWASYTGKPVIVGVRNQLKGVSHAILAFRSVKVSDTRINIEVYDSNYPGELRDIELTVNSKGKVTKWYYKHSALIDVGTNHASSRIEYLTYDIYSAMWKNRGDFTSGMADSNALMVNTDSFIIYGEDNEPVAQMIDGELITDRADIYAVEATDISEDSPELIYLPSDCTYTVVNTDADTENFEATMVNVERSASVTTEGDTVSFTVSDSDDISAVSLRPEKNEKYSIVLDSSDSVDTERTQLQGKGKGVTVIAAQTEGETKLQNCKTE